jgi:hypothetical protein
VHYPFFVVIFSILAYGPEINTNRTTSFYQKKPKAGDRKWSRNQHDRYIRRTAITEEPFIKYKGWEY